jgi:hypothetical protein
MKKYIAAFLMLFSILSDIKADDAFLGTRGGNVFPIIRNETIRMVKEEIRIVMDYDSCKVCCKFWFQNQGSKQENVLTGFPDYFKNMTQHSRVLRNFTCTVNSVKTKVDKMTQVNQYNADAPPETAEYNIWYCWTTHFEPNETVLIENTYVGEWGGAAEGTCSFEYLIGTAQTWNGTICSGKVIFDHSKVASNLFVDTARYSDFPLRPGMERAVYKDSTVYRFNDYLPKWNETLELDLMCYWKNPYGKTDQNLVEYPFKYRYDWRDKYLSKQTLRLMRNEIYARHGYIFKDPGLQNYFTKQGWYKPDKSFDAQQLNNFENAFINYLKEIEQKPEVQKL